MLRARTPTARSFNRKTYNYAMPRGEILREYNGNPVGSIAYYYQFSPYELSEDAFWKRLWCRPRAAPAAHRPGPGYGVTQLGDTYVSRACISGLPHPGRRRAMKRGRITNSSSRGADIYTR
jgi:hypothetical protein